MCGRYALNTTPQQLIETFQLIKGVDFTPRFNIAPFSSVPVIRQSPEGERVADLLRWGLVPHWAKDPSIGNKFNNARGESVAEKPSFRDAFKRRRCLVPASGYYEWHTEGKNKQPYYIHFKSDELMALGGLWESWRNPEGEVIRTFCVVTTSPNAVMEPIHNRMPVIIRPEDYGAWLNPAVPGTELQDMLMPFDPEEMEAWPVSKKVSNAGNEGTELVEPLTLPS